MTRFRAEDSGALAADRIEFLAVLAAGFLICLARTVHPSQRFSLWGEDGLVFTGQVRHLGVTHSFFTTYAGYFNLLPRGVAAAVSGLPLEWTPPLYACAAFATAAVASAVSFRASRRGLNLPAWAAGVIAATVLLLPPSGAETFGTLTNVEWYCEAGAVVFLAAWWLGWKARPWPTALLLFVAFATSPVSVVFLPFVLARAITRRSRLDYTVAAATLLATVYQGIGYLVAPASQSTTGFDLPRLGAMYSVRVVDDTFAGDRLAYAAWNFLTPAGSVVIGCVLFLGLAILALRHPDRPKRGMAMAMIALSLVLFLFPAIERGLDQLPHLGLPSSADGFPWGGRYMGSPSLSLVVVAVVLLAGWTGRWEDRPAASWRANLPTAAFCAVLAVLLVYNVPLNLQRFPLASWEHDVAQARHGCQSNNGRGTIAIENAPGGPWVLRLSCHEAFG